MQNTSIFDQRRSNIHISVTDDQKVRVAARTILRRKFDFSMWPPSGIQTVLRSSKPRATFVSPPSTCLNTTPNIALEGSKSTCVGNQRLPVRST